MFNDKVLLITGGTGSFGNAVLQRFLATNVREIRIFSRDEAKQDAMRSSVANRKLRFYIGDVRDYASVLDAFVGVDYVFHAAALKQVPSCEFHPLEAVKTNVLGAENVLNAALARGVRRVVVLSTDKAVYPINAMGMSKALMEKAMIAKSRFRGPGDTVLLATRYGNVMSSRGSVIPLFVQQIKNKAALTVTDPSMTRFLLSLEDSVDLVLHAFENGQQGDIFVKKAPASTIGDLATALLDIFRSSSPVDIIGTRHGEKIFETLVSREEMAKASVSDGYFRVPADNRDLNYGKYLVEGETRISGAEDYTSQNTTRLGVGELKQLLLRTPFIQSELASID
jgi:UDP-N-acetylglucosamine 4,6-dehydratase/5-epimerase